MIEKKFNPKDFNLQDIIKARVDLEAEVEHAFDPVPALPKYVKLPKTKNYAGWYNFAITTLKQLAP